MSRSAGASKAAVHVPDAANPRSGDVKGRLVEGEMILRDRNAGMPASALMDKYGLSRATVYRRIDEAIAARIVPTVDAYREQQNALLDDLMAKWGEQVETAEAMISLGKATESLATIERGLGVRAAALAQVLRVAERRARLMGTDAPVRVEATVMHTTPVDDAVAALVADIEQRASA